MQHIIKKQVINISVDKKLDPFHIQQLISSNYRNRIVPALQEAFDAASPEDEIIRLDSLEIDLGIINVKQVEKGDWDEYVFKKISEQLIPVKHGLPSKLSVKKSSPALSIAGQWIFYMQHGYLPWNTLQINPAWYRSVLEAFAGDLEAISNLRNLIKRYPGSLKRIVFQHPENFLKALIETLTAENQDVLPGFINELAGIISLPGEKGKQAEFLGVNNVKLKLWEQAFQFTASVEKYLNPTAITLHLIHKNLPGRQLNTKEIADFLLKHQIDTLSPEQINMENQNKESKKLTEEVSITGSMEKGYTTGVDDEGIYVLNAGVVLLHPFLARFFGNLQLVKDEKFTDTLSHQKALYLLHYLATGNTIPGEHELVMAKILCAYPLEEPVTGSIDLGSDELQEAESLLVSAVQQWEILKSSSPDGLRDGFLQRNGKLFTKNSNLHLLVEASSIDMLLDHLPWNVSIVKLPWMTEILKVEWR